MLSKERRELLGEFVRFALNAGVVLGLKVVGVALLTPYLHASIAYALIHVFTVLASYLLHLYVSFRGQKATLSDFFQFLKAVIGIKIADYVVFNVLFTFFEIKAMSAVVLATAGIFFLRFVTIRRALKGRKRGAEPASAGVDEPEPAGATGTPGREAG